MPDAVSLLALTFSFCAADEKWTPAFRCSPLRRDAAIVKPRPLLAGLLVSIARLICDGDALLSRRPDGRRLVSTRAL